MLAQKVAVYYTKINVPRSPSIPKKQQKTTVLDHFCPQKCIVWIENSGGEHIVILINLHNK